MAREVRHKNNLPFNRLAAYDVLTLCHVLLVSLDNFSATFEYHIKIRSEYSSIKAKAQLKIDTCHIPVTFIVSIQSILPLSCYFYFFTIIVLYLDNKTENITILGVVTRWESRGTVLNRLLNKLTSLKGENDMMIKEQIFNTLAQMETLMITNQPPHIPIVKFVNGEEEAILPGTS